MSGNTNSSCKPREYKNTSSSEARLYPRLYPKLYHDVKETPEVKYLKTIYKNNGDKFIINMKVDENYPELKQKYLELQKHNRISQVDSGFDLFTPRNYTIPPRSKTIIDLCVSFECFTYRGTDPLEGTSYPTGFLLYARSSISKTPLILCNSVGVIDSGYRGNVKAVVYNTSDDETVKVNSGSRLFQVVHPTLISSKYLTVLDSLTESERGSGGFGSTG